MYRSGIDDAQNDNTPSTAGADLNELAQISTADAFRTGWLKDIEAAFTTTRKPIIAAVRGFAVRSVPS